MLPDFYKCVKTRVVHRPSVVCKKSLWVVVYFYVC